LLLAVGAFATSAIEPNLVDRAIVGEQLTELVPEVLIVFRRFAIGGLVAVPRRKVQTDTNLLFAERIDDFTNDVALAVAPAGIPDAVLGELGGPEAESVVVFGG
jgi:hypothetical protein